eukprot:3736245-Amphidinium_carterae.1
MPRWKAAADVALAVALVLAARYLGPPLAASFNHCLQHSAVPAAYSGKGLCQIVLTKAYAYAQFSSFSLRLGTLRRHCLHASLCAPDLRFWAEQHSAAMLFIDGSQAFDSVPLPMIWGLGASEDDAGGLHALQRRGYSVHQVAGLLDHLEKHPATLGKLGVPNVVMDLLCLWGTATWMIAVDTSREAILPPTGVPQGHNLSALLFDLFYADLTQDIDGLLAIAGQCWQLLTSDSRLPLLAETDVDVL